MFFRFFFFTRKRDSNTFTLFRRQKNYQKGDLETNLFIFLKKKRCLIKTTSKTHISEKFKKLFFFWSRLVFFHQKIIFLFLYETFVETFFYIHFLLLFLTFFKTPLFLGLTSFPSLFTLFCVSIQELCFLVWKERFFCKHGRVPTRRSGKTWVFVFAHLSPKRKGCFSKQTKVKNTFSQTSRKSKNECWRNNFWDFS